MQKLVRNPNKLSVLAIGAHSDDAILGIGAYLAELSEQGHQVTILSLSSGELAGDPLIREGEDRAAAAQIGADILFGGLPDGEITIRAAIATIEQTIAAVKPSIVFVHDAGDTHQDHVTTHRAATIACRAVAKLFTYEGPSSVGFIPAITLDISKTWQRKLDALTAYPSQLARKPLLSWVTAASAFRAWPRHVGAQCEGLKVGHTDALGINPASFAAIYSEQVSEKD